MPKDSALDRDELTLRIKTSLRKAEKIASGLRKTNTRLLVSGISASGISTLVAGLSDTRSVNRRGCSRLASSVRDCRSFRLDIHFNHRINPTVEDQRSSGARNAVRRQAKVTGGDNRHRQSSLGRYCSGIRGYRKNLP